MADTLTTQSATPATVPANSVIATDDAGAAGHVQIVKLAVSTDGSATALTANNTDGLLVNLGSNNDVTVTGTVTANVAAGTNNIGDVDVLTLPALPAGTNNIGDVDIASIAAGDNNIGNVDVVTLPAVTNAGTFAVQESGAALTALQLIDDTVYTDGTGTPSKAIGIAGTDGTNPQIVKTDASGELQVDVLTMPTVAVTQSGTWDEVGINDSGNSITVDNAALSVTGGGVEASALRVTLASDSTGVVSVDDNGGSLTVDAASLPLPTGASTLAEQQSQTTHLATIAGDTTDIEAAVELIDDTVATLGTTTYSEATTKGLIIGAVRRDADTTLVDTTNEVSPLQVDASGRLKVEAFSGETLPVSLASVPSHAVTNAGTFATQSDGTALTRLTDIETNTGSGAVVGNGAAATAQRVTLANDSTGIVSLTTSTASIGKLAANSGVDIGDVDVTSLPALVAGTAAIGKLRPPDIDVTGHTNYAKKYYTNAGAVTDGIVWSPAAGTRWHVVSMFINVSAAATVTFEDDKAGGDEAVMKMELAANSGMTINYGEKYPLASGEDAADLIVTTSAGNIYITVTGYEI
jgi:hypothetical protein